MMHLLVLMFSGAIMLKAKDNQACALIIDNGTLQAWRQALLN